MNNKRNLVTSIILQIVTIISGLILPRLILAKFGSEINGLVSSITQFLSFISLLEGGLGAVALAELYKPISTNNTNKIKEILEECQNFFTKISLIYIVYSIILALVYPFFCISSQSYEFISSLVVILSLSTLIKYLFSITYKSYLQANQQLYLINIASTIIIILNLILACLVLILFPQIHLLKFISDLLFFIQPIMYKKFIDKKYYVGFSLHKANKNVLKNKYSGFFQNLSYFINMNTDVVVITLFVNIISVSIYSIYMLVINSLKSFITLISNSYQSALGKYYAEDKIDLLQQKFKKLEGINFIITLTFFYTCLILINYFVNIYTVGITDANYYQPVFSAILVFAYMFYCILEPRRYLILAIGKFKEVNYCYFVEALINIVVSIVLSHFIGIVGVAIGTFIAVIFRLIYYIVYFRNKVIYINLNYYVKPCIIFIITLLININIYININLGISNLFSFILKGTFVFLIELILNGGVFALLYYNTIKKIRKK